MTEAQFCIVLANVWSASFVVRPSAWSVCFTILFTALGVFFKVT